MTNITIGIPRGLLYYRHKYLYETFFKELGINILISPNIEIKDNKNICNFLKIFFEHINYLKDKVDYILVPFSINDKCHHIRSLYDITNNTFNLKLLSMNIDNKEESFINIGHKLGISKQRVLDAYKQAKKEEYKKRKINYLIQNKKLERDTNKILFICEDYIYYDEKFKNKYLNIFKDNKIDVIYSNIVNPDAFFDEKTYKKAIFNNINTLKKYVDIIIVISTYPCVLKNIDFEEIFSEKDVNISYLTINNDFNLKVNI